jgi:hypothetical protein
MPSFLPVIKHENAKAAKERYLREQSERERRVRERGRSTAVAAAAATVEP